MMQDLDPSKFHIMTPQLKRNLIIFGALLFLVVLPILGYWYYNFALHRPTQSFKEASFRILEGESVTEIAARLNDVELVNSEFLFKAYLISQGLHTRIQAGVYNIPAGASIYELAQIFQHGTNDVAITFIEGWRAEEFARHSSQFLENVDYEKFLRMIKEHEGYLFPDTYFFNSDVTEEEVLDVLLSTFERKTSGVLTSEALANAGLSKDQVLNFASIVEREVHNDVDRPIVAGILIKRWQNGELIGADATTQYALASLQVCETSDDEDCPTPEQALTLNWWPQVVTVDDIRVESPYNTRVVVGLPPSPIANPGLNAIQSVLEYRETPYNYYLTDSAGVAHYAVTLEEHNQNVRDHL